MNDFGNNNDAFSDQNEPDNSLDCTLLESLFYNEMIRMDHQLLLPASLEGLAAANTNEDSSSSSYAMNETLTAAEQALLHDFGVMDDSAAVANGGGALQQSAAAPIATLAPQTAMQTHISDDARGCQITQRLNGSNSTQVIPVPTHSPQHQGNGLQPAAAHLGGGALLQQQQSQLMQQQTHQQQLLPADDNKQRSKLLAQFTTLASRLGIDLPMQALQSLTSSTTTSSGATAANAAQAPESAASVEAAALALQNSENDDSRKRSIVAAESTEGTDSDAATRQSTTTTNASAASAFKRRKRPRPTDCDAKLALLQEENAILQSRLAALCSQNQRANQDRDEHAHQLSRLLQQQNASPDEMQKLIDHYQELYSDYGRRRHLELQWHLEQLERLANPTNVTKMGLYTLGQGPLMNGSTAAAAGGGHGRGSNPQPDSPSSRTLASKPTTNPIVGLLQKELGITGPQNKKILEQRAKIRTVCANLRECLALLNKLKELCEEKTRIFHDRLSRCREILTPEQVLKLLVWIHEHNETVSQACPGWGSEHLPVSKAL